MARDVPTDHPPNPREGAQNFSSAGQIVTAQGEIKCVATGIRMG